MGVEKQIRRVSITVPPERAGQKVDTLLRKELGLSGTVIRRIKWLEDGILLDGERVFTSRRVEPGQVLTVRLSDPERRSGVVPAPGPLDIVYEDGDMLVLNKAPGVLVHPGAGHFSDTIGNFLLDYYDRTGVEADFHPVHRLDKGTSGLMVVAKHPHAQEVLKNQLHTAEFRRIYLAVCLGGPAEERGTVDAPIGMAEGSIVARAVRPDGLPARTHYRVLERRGDRTLVRLALETGRTHQIRVHMAYIGHPILGDTVYGAKKAVPGLQGQCLHAVGLRFLHPRTGEAVELRCPLPESFLRQLEKLEART